jgi:ABC-type multidrug transport system fused ATPase/permease subunit
LFGALLLISSKLSREETRQRTVRESNEDRLKYLKRMAEESAEQGRTMMQTASSSFKLTLIALYGLVIILLIVLRFSPIDMIWWLFLVCLLLSFMVTERLFQLAKAGKFSTSERTSQSSS